jgi:hypothetical protein
MLGYEITIQMYGGVNRTIVPQDNLIEFILLLQSAKDFKLIGLNYIADYTPYEDLVEILKNVTKPEGLEG